MTRRVVWLIGPEEIEIRKMPVPEPGRGEILVRIDAATTCGTDVKVFRRGGHPRMIRVPAPFGHELAGTIARCGTGVGSFVEGERVVVANSASCGECRACRSARENLCERLVYLNGAFAEVILVPEVFVRRSVHRIPETLPSEIAALAEPSACVLHGIEMLDLDRPAEIVVYGAGPIGLLFVALLSSGGHHVVCADPNPSRLEMARRLGASETIEIERGGGAADAVRASSPSGAGFDIAVDGTGIPEVWSDAIASVRAGGTVELFGGCAPGTSIPLDTHRLHYSELTILGAYHHRPANFALALERLADGAFDARLLLTAEYPLENVGAALQAMMRKEVLKAVIRPWPFG